MRPIAVIAILSAFSSSAASQEALTVRGPTQVIERLGDFSNTIAEWHPDLEVYWVGDEAGVSFAPLFDGSADLLLSPREIEPWERALAALLSLEIHEDAAALDAVSVVVHPDNRVESLSLEQLQTLFSGKILGWYGFGGSDLPIRLLAPSPSSGEYQALKEIFPGGDVRLPPSVDFVSAPRVVISTVLSDPRSVGLVAMSLDATKVRTVPLRASASLPPVAPSAASVESGEYPWSRVLWLYRRGSAHEGLRRFLSSFLSSEGQAEMAKAGFVALPADRAFQRTLAARERSRGATLTRVRFAPGVDSVDGEARALLTQTAQASQASQASQARKTASDVWITGHAAPEEDRSGAVGLSERRARAVEAMLTNLRVAVRGAEGVGADGGDRSAADVWWIPRR